MNFLRKLARSKKWQFLYSRAKEMNIKLFNNDADFTKIQIAFLQWLEVYNSLYTDLLMDKDYISEEVINDDIRTDAYLLFKSKHKNDFDKATEKKKEIDNFGSPTIIFRKK